MRSKQFLEEVRKAEGLCRAVLRKIEVGGREITFHLITDVNYSAGDINYASEVAQKYVPAGYTARVQVLKSVPSEEGVRREIANILRKRFPAASAFVMPEKIAVAIDGTGGRFFIPLGESDRSILNGESALDIIHEELQRMFCGTWYGEFTFTEQSRGEIEREAPPPAELILAPRFFDITEYVAIDGAKPTRAIYIADLTKEMTEISVCGTVSYIEERQTKKGKPYFGITLSDGTGTMRCSYFSKKATLEKVRSLKQGDSVCLSGDNEIFGGGFSFRAKHIDFGMPPQGFVPEARPSRPVPVQYRTVYPAPAADLVQGMLFGEVNVSEAIRKRTFVVFDLETTGLGLSAVMDRIIEVGAVKIKDGKIVERFSTFVSCPTRLPQEIIELTGITDDMLTGAPKIEDVIADFYKFCDGCELVAHNAPFDCKFIRYYGEQEGYLFDHTAHDTVALAQAALPGLGKYRLNNIADHFGFTFNHHRAYDDAFVTAKIFLELVKMKDGLL